MKSSVCKRSIVIAGHKTSVSLEEEFWKSLKEIAGERGMTLPELVAEIDGNRQHPNLSSAIRLFVLGVYRDAEAGRFVLIGTAVAGDPVTLQPKVPGPLDYSRSQTCPFGLGLGVMANGRNVASPVA